MPIINSPYSRPWYMPHHHIETIYPNRFRPTPKLPYVRQRLELADGDFMDLDWLKRGKKRLSIIIHGLEGDSNRPYVRGMASAFHEENWDVLAMNCRSCSGEINRNFCLYHHGVSEDLKAVVDEVKDQYDEIRLIGFSMGGAILLKYLGEQGKSVPGQVQSAVAISTPCHLPDSVRATQRKGNGIYVHFFLKQLGAKIKAKAAQFPDRLDPTLLKSIKDLYTFTGTYTAPMYGYESAEAFFDGVSAFPHLPNIAVPTLILNAENDPMLEGDCYPHELARNHPFIHLETPVAGGHVGFMSKKGRTYAEVKSLSRFIL
ncbi:MAG: YheT family hydrolase [Bacteroidia bacterium]